MKIEIDPNAGFCFGVVNAIGKAEENLSKDGQLYCIGDIVHNSIEVNRLNDLGLQTIEHDEFKGLKGKKVLFRAHGEPPSSYQMAKKNKIEIIDATCPVVLNLQKRIKKAYRAIKEEKGQILIYGKKGHAEVNGLVGQTEGNAIVIETVKDLKSVNLELPVELFSQTTKTLEGFKLVREQLKNTMKASFKAHDTICRKVANRVPYIKEFAQKHDVVVFVSGKKSSNGKLLFNVCKGANRNSYFISEPQDIDMSWFANAKSIGVSGATSTPAWLMNEISEKIKLENKINISMSRIKKIGVLTSGGDAPGMNAAIRAVVRTAIFNKLEVVGIKQGYEGLINGDFKKMKSHDVSNIIGKGGTILRSARSQEFRTVEGRQKAYQQMLDNKIDALVVIGGDGTFSGARIFTQEHDIPVVGIPGTIDNDLYGTDYTIGYDTAINTVIDAVDKIRDTASAHNRLFFIEVMGRDAGFIALRSGIATGAEAILIPEKETHAKELQSYLEKGYKEHKSSGIVIVAEGDKSGGAYTIAKEIEKEHPEYDIRVSILGHMQRGGSPSAFDRVTASTLGVAAVEALLDDQKSIMVGLVHGDVTHVPFNKTIKNKKKVKDTYLHINEILSI
ncbi:6-phosphofructokinase [Marinifilum caeruleilacunae]|jgi:6-phosphofructokinase/(E)-4-hydroxy-3-methyl-but-2-enyl pyrophosphate reductase|uniref:Multifunctional fusion protein n=1 Tax=Marinifilum caeruleilacunae TaxID=2499076 RepID=A0ABX1WRN7_9BACT|nr:6-phosphofructokinase [Marinifilum caeruleilacunae]NOU58752.1 6-phosphofructokinase [Marinifilum caeruleilacunae]